MRRNRRSNFEQAGRDIKATILRLMRHRPPADCTCKPYTDCSRCWERTRPGERIPWLLETAAREHTVAWAAKYTRREVTLGEVA